MNTENMEVLLERLINVNEAILDKLDQVRDEVITIKQELDWTKEHSYANIVYGEIDNISTTLVSIESGVSNIDTIVSIT